MIVLQQHALWNSARVNCCPSWKKLTILPNFMHVNVNAVTRELIYFSEPQIQ